MMKIAIVTGASSGMGREFARQIAQAGEVEELWVIARRAERLKELQEKLRTPVRIFALDLTKKESFEELGQALKEQKPDVKILVNASGFGKYGTYRDLTDEEISQMIDLNCKAVVRATYAVLPYMKEEAGY